MTFEFTPVLRIVLVILATYRITNLFVYDLGPFHIFENIRSQIGRLCANSSKIRWLGELINCPFCLGVWIAFLLSFAVIFPTLVVDILILPFAISGGQDFMTSLGKGRNE